ncbi:hypothetical protein ACX80E_12440 [Arthrobacter sp. TMN-49]
MFCEKPAGLTLAELDAALVEVESAGVHFQIGFNRRYADDFGAAKREVSAGVIGRPQLQLQQRRRGGSKLQCPLWL